jgi:hypothetical protein
LAQQQQYAMIIHMQLCVTTLLLTLKTQNVGIQLELTQEKLLHDSGEIASFVIVPDKKQIHYAHQAE